MYVVGYWADHWNQFPDEIYRQMPNQVIDVRHKLPNDPAGKGGKARKGKGKGFRREHTVDQVMGQEKFVDSVAEVVGVLLQYSKAIVGCLLAKCKSRNIVA